MFTQLLTNDQADTYYQRLREELDYVPRKYMVFKIFGKSMQLPRDKQFYGDIDEEGNTPMYRYGSDWYPPVKPWTPVLEELRDVIQEQTGQYCNHVVVNRYRGGSDHIGYHHDKTPDFVDGSSVCTLSFGAPRTFQIRNLKNGEVTSYQTSHGSLCMLDWETNLSHKHRIAKTAKDVGERISLTYRSIKSIRSREDNEVSAKRFEE